jgi:eukaryotic-like serine/threonine-protein kinase
MEPKKPDILDILGVCAEVPVADRGAAARRMCGVDDEAFAEVMRHLDVLRREEEDPLIPEITADPARPVRLNARDTIGPCRVVEKIGEGGQATVWRAHQAGLNRSVALKVIQEPRGTGGGLDRFKFERNLLASVVHENVAKVYVSGEEVVGGTPVVWFAMEYVECGCQSPLTIERYSESMGLDARGRVRLVIGACRGVHAAHSRGVLHRDLKPSNVMVARSDKESEPVAKVIDFGVSTLVDAANSEELSEHGGSVASPGTLAYMSPEQTGYGQTPVATVQSDVYGLGAILRELFTGSPPFSASDFRDAGTRTLTIEKRHRFVRESNPRAPEDAAKSSASHARFVSLLRGDLGAIIRKAMRKDPTLRYESAAAMARDLQRWLDHEPVEAVGGGAWYRTRKLVRRNPWASALLGTSVLAILGSGITSIVLYGQAEQQRAAADRSARDASVSLEITEVALNALAKSPMNSDAASESLRRSLLSEVEAHARVRCVQSPDTLGVVLLSLTKLAREFSLLDDADRLARESLVLAESGSGSLSIQAGHALNLIGLIEHDQGKGDQSLATLTRAVAVLSSASGPASRVTLHAQNDRGVTLFRLTRFDEADGIFTATIKGFERLGGPTDLDAIKTRNNLAFLAQARGDAAGAVNILERVTADLRAATGATPRDLVEADNNLGLMYVGVGRQDDAVRVLRAAVAFARERLSSDHSSTTTTIGNLGHALLSGHKSTQGWDDPRLAEALELFREADRMNAARLGPDHYASVIQRHNLAKTLRLMGRYPESAALAVDAVARGTKTKHPNASAFQTNATTCREEWGRWLDSQPIDPAFDAERDAYRAFAEQLAGVPTD